MRIAGTTVARGAWISVFILGLAACGGRADEDKDCPAAVRARAFSGFCVPRYVSLKRGLVYGRKGPGKDYPAVFIYHALGLPVQVVAETEDWRRICDPGGGATWVHRSMVDGRRTVMALGNQPIPLRRKADASAPAAALLNAHALAYLNHCQGAWCRVKVGGVTGWLGADQVWGAAAGPQCH